MRPENTSAEAAAALIGRHSLEPRGVTLRIGGFGISIRSNANSMLDRLAAYFSDLVCHSQAVDIEVIAIERDAPLAHIDFIDWAREAGKTGRKDSTLDIVDGRMIRKVRTGMVFLQSWNHRVAAGPCIENDNQVINFINAQYMNWLQQQGWLICHAAAICKPGGALGIAGFSGGGKSTLMLQMLEDERFRYVSNDRLMVRREGKQLLARGIPKMPRINPGTIVHNPRLQALIPKQERERLLNLPTDELWDLEDKYDVMVRDTYAREPFFDSVVLKGFAILNWDRHRPPKTSVSKLDLGRTPDRLHAVMKSPGPFYQRSDGSFQENGVLPDPSSYRAILQRLPMYEVSGSVDFSAASQHLTQIMEQFT